MTKRNDKATTTPATTRPRASIISPTRNEAANVDEFVKRVVAAMLDRDVEWEIVFADDSDDDTPAAVTRFADQGLPVRVVHRAPADRVDSIAGAVKAALATCTSAIAVVIDGDLQHPPEVLPSMIGPILSGQADFCIGTRYGAMGSAEGLGSPWRRMASRASALFTQAVFPQYFRCTDLASGLFAFRIADLGSATDVRSTGFKFLPEALVRCDPDRVADIPYVFEERFGGLSKATVLDGVKLARALVRLRTTTRRIRPVSMVPHPLELAVPFVNAQGSLGLPQDPS